MIGSPERPTSNARWPLAPHTMALVCNGEHHYQIATGEPYPRCGGAYGKPLTPLVKGVACDRVRCAHWHGIKAPPWKRDASIIPPWERG